MQHATLLQIICSRIGFCCLANLYDSINISFHNWNVADGEFSNNVTNGINTLPLIDEKL